MGTFIAHNIIWKRHLPTTATSKSGKILYSYLLKTNKFNDITRTGCDLQPIQCCILQLGFVLEQNNVSVYHS